LTYIKPEEDVAGVLRLVLDPLGRESRFAAVADPRTNRVFMTGDPRRMNLAAKWIERIDRPLPGGPHQDDHKQKKQRK
jgi:hypothetical protein